ncbi:YceI family protein [Gelidibacter salicanalis]|uniref:YceI family protein n=1 Tax=Gelidibacter salicanalis TaxID=291193 RepID=A0A5C7AEV3_9FLAO|nr:YceI family protein [Gelidibacter salicanalis]TXE07310.1 YceI family protein [Gelidibacter salicanalis]
MTTTKSILKPLWSLFILLLLAIPQINAQTYNLDNGASKLTVSGTSSLHDWDLDAEQQKGQIILNSTDEMTIEKLTLQVTAESLTSGKGAMDKNTYKALDTKKHKSINFQLTEVKKMTASGSDNYKVDVVGNLTIAGVTKKQTISMDVQVAGNKVTLKGKKAFKMSDFGIDPPKALLGTITTGDEVTITFHSILNK